MSIHKDETQCLITVLHVIMNWLSQASVCIHKLDLDLDKKYNKQTYPAPHEL